MRPSLSRAFLGFVAFPVAAEDVRAETWTLGSRYRGEVVHGARQELCAPNLSLRRTILLNAVIRAQKSRRASSGRPS